MKKLFTILIFVTILVTIMTFVSSAKVYEFDLSDEDLSSEDELSNFISSLPDNIKDKLTEISVENSSKIAEKYSFRFFLKEIKDIIAISLPEIFKSLVIIISSVIIISISNKLFNLLPNQALSQAFTICSSLVLVLSLMGMQNNILSETKIFLSTLSDTMLMIVPVMEAIYISSGNFTLMSVTSTSLNLMITFTINLFDNVIFPAISVSLVIAAFSAVTQNKSIIYLSKCLRSVITTTVILTMALMSFILTLQVNTSAASDNFANKTIRYALGNYIPIVGSSVSETYSLMQSSILVLKSLAGTTSIVVLILICLKPIITIALGRFSLSISKNLYGLLGCERNTLVFEEISAAYTLLLAVTISCITMYIIALAQFSKASIWVT